MFIAHELPEEIAELAFATEKGSVHLPALIAEAFGHSRSEARRLVVAGAVRLDGAVLPSGELDVPVARLDGKVLQVGKRGFRRLHLI